MNATPKMVLTESVGPDTTVLTLNRPEKRNALCIELLEELVSAIAIVEADPLQRLLIVRGAGPTFCSGLDLVEAADATQSHRSAALIAKSLLMLSGTRLVTIACVHGATIAGGAGLLSACDLGVAAADTMIGYPEPRRGLVAGLVMTFLRRQLRERDAREILLTGEMFPADRAKEMGLVNRVAPTRDAAFAEALELASSVRRGAPQAIVATKRMLAELWHRPVKADLDHAFAIHLEARGSPEAAEGIAAFREKRPPRWSS
jgi:methylglutaconyl-CoA hydratase